MRGEKNDLIFHFLVAARDFADHVAGVPLFPAFAIEIEFAGDVLYISAVIAGRFNANFTQLRGEISGGEQFVMGTAGASLHDVTSEKFHPPPDLPLIFVRLLRRSCGK